MRFSAIVWPTETLPPIQPTYTSFSPQISATTALELMPTANELSVLTKHVTTDINLSLKQAGSIPALLASSPWTVNYLGQLRLLAYSESALRVVLKQPNDQPFQYIQ